VGRAGLGALLAGLAELDDAEVGALLHGPEGQVSRGCTMFEFYRNDFDKTAGGGSAIFANRGGNGVYFENTAVNSVGTYHNGLALTYYRADNAGPPPHNRTDAWSGCYGLGNWERTRSKERNE